MTVVARAEGVLGELVLRRGDDGVLELVSNGVFLMDSGDGSTERRLATAALDAAAGDDLDVVVGGLGLGSTAQAVADDGRVRTLTVVEIEPALVSWVRDGLVPSAAALLDAPHVDVVVGDVASVVPGLPVASVDAVLLDVDNGPGFLVHPANARLYAAPFLNAAAERLRAGGVLAVWSADADEGLESLLASVLGRCDAERLVVRRSRRDLDYWLYVARRR